MRAERGLTLLELLVVLTILGLLAGLAAAAHGGLAGRRHDQAVARAASMLRGARHEAMVAGHVVNVQVSSSGMGARPTRHALTMSAGGSHAHLAWTGQPVAGQRSEHPAFYPDGSAAPGVVELTMGGTVHRLVVDWQGGVRDGSALP
jgi:type II secretion system protein H